MYVNSKLTPAEKGKVPTPGYVPLLWEELQLAMSLTSGSRPRVYGYVEGEPYGEIVAIRSPYDVERFTGRLSFAWLSNSTIADLIKEA